MTYRVVKDEPCRWYEPCRVMFAPDVCTGCRGNGTRMVEVAVVEGHTIERWNGEMSDVWMKVEP